MATCTQWVNRLVITCKDWSSQVDYECTTWADEGSNACSEWADEGSSQCTSWEECHWYTPWDCIAGFFCRAYYWVAKWVCKAWYWVAKWVCKAFAWVVKTVCIFFAWSLQLVCIAWDTARCIFLALWRLLSSLFGRGGRGARPKIEHVFVLMLENRSFDHMFAFSGIKGGLDVNGQPTSFNEGFDPATATNVDPLTNAVISASAPADFQLKNLDADPGHEFKNTVTALCGAGAHYDPVPGGYPPIDNSGFIQNYIDTGATTPDRIMRCYSEAQLPVLNELARKFVVCDRWFSSLPGPTFPNRFFLLAATSGGLDGSPGKLDVVTSTTVEGYRFENGSIFDLLDTNCINWSVYAGDDFPVCFALSGMNLNRLQGRIHDFDDFETDLSQNAFGSKFIFIEPKYGSHEFDATGPGDFTCGNSMHPLDDVTRGEKLIKKVYEAIRNSPLWEKSMLLVTFDEHGGFYDHVAPPPAVSPGDLITPGYVQNHFQFDQLGVRVPALVISPWVGHGVIDHTTYDHTSMLATVERLFHIGHLTKRDQAANDFLHLFNLTTPRTDCPVTLPNAATNPSPLACDDEPSNADQLLLKRSELRVARDRGHYLERRVTDYRLTRTQIGFLQIALLKLLPETEQPEKAQWIEQYKQIATGVDAAIFMVDAKLKLRHGIDLKKLNRIRLPVSAARRHPVPPTQL